MDAQVGKSDPALRFSAISQRYGGVVALQDIDLEIPRGTIHALVGENGAGKSTCLGIASGRVVPSSGSLAIFGKSAPLGRPREFRRHGVASIYQELTIAPNLTPSENIFLGRFRSKMGLVDAALMRSRYEQLARQMGVAVHSEVPAKRLSVAEQQVLEILRALASEARIILLDEPTASLARAEREALLSLMKRLREEGFTLVFVSHNLDEVLEVADRITVFRDGAMVAQLSRAEANKKLLVRHMLGDKRVEVGEARRSAAVARSPLSLLKMTGVTLPGVLSQISLEVHGGEILGIGGLVGSGRTSLLRSIAGLEPLADGTLSVKDELRAWPKSVQQARKYGIVLIPEDRKDQGIVPLLSAAENIGLARLRQFCGSPIVSARSLARAASGVAQRYGFDSRRLAQAAGTLSGGNQQKLLLARASAASPLVLLADEPTRGIDIGAKSEITRSLREVADSGCGVVVVSSELEELAAICDRVVVLHEGMKVGELDPSDSELSVAAILNMAFGVGSGADLANDSLLAATPDLLETGL